MEGSQPIFHQESTAHALVDGSGADDGNAYTHDPNSISQDAATSVVYEAKADAATAGHSEGVVTDENMASISQNMAGYDSVDRSTSEMTNYRSTEAVMNRSVSKDTGGAVVEQAYDDVTEILPF
ncbi:hypothetical protein MUK42_14896 [Musa troglodytarum]|uniref:Uncharacterized protein n=1 Tax=Musa troglodytarum TaxID=320322 RepID=A0A9E7JHE6_9LILI|nr:hypothetical protein MUK42_02851 [Musa troglodytarum]URD81253.1 hypothetical protein MUK42_14896 [Musa troglodytarum]